MTASTIDRTIERLARRQHGAFSDRQASRLGASLRMKRRRVAAGQWLRLGDNVFALASHPGTWLRQCMAATLSIERAILSHSSAAALHCLDGFRRCSQHITVPPDGTRRSRLAKVHQQGWPQGTIVNGIQVVALPDTFFQLVAVADPERIEHAFADAIVEHDWLLAALSDRYVDLAKSRLPGIAIIRTMLEQHDDGTAPPNSELERILDRVLSQLKDLPPLQRQAPLPGWDAGPARVDVMVPDWRLIIEADGRRWHTRVDDFETDHWRDNVATAAGYDVLRFTYRQLTQTPHSVRALLSRYAANRNNAA